MAFHLQPHSVREWYEYWQANKFSDPTRQQVVTGLHPGAVQYADNRAFLVFLNRKKSRNLVTDIDNILFNQFIDVLKIQDETT